MARFFIPSFVLLISAATATACSPKAKEDAPEAKAGAPVDAETSADDADVDATSGGESGESGEAQAGETDDETGAGAAPAPIDLAVKTGVPSCDAYAQWWTPCLSEHAPDDQRSDLERELSEQLAAWKQTVDGGGSATAVEIGCATALEAAKAMSAEWGCAAPKKTP